MNIAHKEELHNRIAEIIAQGSLEKASVLSFGHCSATVTMIDYLSHRGINVTAILDNNKSKQGLDYRGIPIISPEEIKNHTAKDSVVLIASRFFEQMMTQLRSLGYRGEIIKVMDYNSYADYSLNDIVLSRKKDSLIGGYSILRQIRTEYPTHHMIVCPYNALGDVYWAMAFLRPFCEKYSIQECVIVLVGNGCYQVAKLFGMESVIMLGQSKMDSFAQALIFTETKNCTIAHHDLPYTDNKARFLNKYFLPFQDCYRYGVYSLPKETVPSIPSNITAFTQCDKLIKGHSLILAPYAKSVAPVAPDFWKTTAQCWCNKGYSVFTSVTGSETAVAGTVPISIPLSQMQAATEYAGQFIGLRSGLCDILIAANCKKTVVFPDCYYSTTPHKVSDFFSIPDWDNIVVKV